MEILTNRNVSVFKHSNENNFDWNYSLAGFISQTLHHFARKEEPDLLASSKFHSLFSYFMWSEIQKASMEWQKLKCKLSFKNLLQVTKKCKCTEKYYLKVEHSPCSTSNQRAISVLSNCTVRLVFAMLSQVHNTKEC